jgi:hypothetical protein
MKGKTKTAGARLDDPTGTVDQKPRWEGPPENRPRGYLPAKDDPEVDRDAAGENLADPDKRDLSDAFAQKGDGERPNPNAGGERTTLPGDDDPDVRYLSENTDLSPYQAREVIAKHGHDRRKLLEIARTMKAEG